MQTYTGCLSRASVAKNILMKHVCVVLVPLFNYCSITSNLILCFQKFTKETKEHTSVLSRRLLKQMHSLRNRCTFALANGLAGRNISRYWVSLIDFGLRPSRELVWHLSTKANNGLLAVYITVFDPRRGKRRCLTPPPSSERSGLYEYWY